MSKNKDFYDSLERERLEFDKGNCTLPSFLVENFRRWDGLLQEDDHSIQKLSSGRRSIRRRSRGVLEGITKELGPEVLLLCTSVTTISKLAELDPCGLIFDLRKWWDAAVHPRLLTEAADAICNAYPRVSKLSLSAGERAVAAFEHAIEFAAQHIPETERQDWRSSCFDHLRLLERLTCVDDGDRRRSNRKGRTGQEGKPDNTKNLPNDNIQARNTSSFDNSMSQPSEGATERSKPGTADTVVVLQVQDAGHIETDASQAPNFGSEIQARKRHQAEEDFVRNQEDAGEPLPKRARMTSQQIPGTLILPGDGYCPFVLTTRQMISNLPEPFRTGIMMSDGWREELTQGGLEVTSCFSLYLPKVEDDVYVVLRVGYRWGWNICNTYGFGEELL